MKTIKKTVSSFYVESLANGNMLVHVRYINKSIEKDVTPVGVGTRLAIKSEISTILNKAVK